MTLEDMLRTGAPKRNAVCFSAFCKGLGAELRVIRSSWSAYGATRHRAVFTVWRDRLVNGHYVFHSASNPPHQSTFAGKELRRNLETVMRTGDEALGIVCYRRPDSPTNKRGPYIENTVLNLRVGEENGDIVGHVTGILSVGEVRGRTGITIPPQDDAINDLGAPPPERGPARRVDMTVSAFVRDNAVRRHVVRRAKGRCEYCGRQDFQIDKGRWYLEAHHIIALSKEGSDTTQNVIALCSRHHREAHYGVNADDLEKAFIRKLIKLGYRAS